jgi:L-ascorbate metabolism protein UlaG (beta-lactamase superfamily)
VKQVHQLDWWQQKAFEGIQFHAVPARHWSMRTLTDRNRSLWCGWVIHTASLRFWFSGDSGYTENLHAIAARLGPFNLAALPVGAYEPRWFMAGQHMDPQQAVSLWHAIGQPLTIPVHWGVFELADESLDAPPAELLRVLQQRGEASRHFTPWQIGESRSLSYIDQA